MKELTSYNRVAGYLNKIFDLLNEEFFENVLSRMCGKNVEIFASGRTDAGVHADDQTANFKCDCQMSDEEIRELYNKNGSLPTVSLGVVRAVRNAAVEGKI